MAASGSKRPTRSRGTAPTATAPRKPARASARTPAQAPAEAPAGPKPEAATGRSIWLAGLGALARAQAEGARHFQALVKAGIDFDGQLRKAARTRGEAAGELIGAVGDAFGARVRSALPVVGRAEFDALAARVETLARRVEQLQRGGTARPAAAARRGGAEPRPGAHAVRRVRDELADVAKELENAQIAARATTRRSGSRKR
ncbi:MAG TPA: phasin family protein [Dokdonella sp.]|uniref:phasin family protein n=1 Tax=Dokdonella sp. TaxID=2291710 RepID=UPI002C24902D|nr:phasin family protein [Dokdonella sp.]HUD42729.1 phasin family protein [Dokdonella sp.]